MTKSWMFIAVVALASCGSKKQDAPSKEEGTSSATATPGAGSGSAEATVSEADLFTGSTVTLPTPASKLHFGMTEAEAKAAAPEVFAAKYGYEIPGTKVKYDSTKLATQFSKAGKLWNIRIELLASQDDAKAWLTKKWGPPVEQKNSIGTPEYFWTAPEAGLAAKLEQRATKSTVYFSHIMPVAQLLGSDPKLLGFEPAPLIGMTKDAALAAFAAYDPTPRDADPDSIVVAFPPTETGYENVGSSLDLRIKSDKVAGYTFSFAAHDPAEVDRFAARLETVFGKGTPDQTKLYTDYKGPPKAKAELRKDTGFSSTLWVGDYRK